MDDESNPLHDLTPPQVVEYARHRMLELEYWQHVLGDAQAITDAVLGVASGIRDATEASLHLLLVTTPDGLPHIEAVIEHNTKALGQAKRLEESLQSLIDLAEGRGKSLQVELVAIRTAAGLEPDDDGESAES